MHLRLCNSSMLARSPRYCNNQRRWGRWEDEAAAVDVSMVQLSPPLDTPPIASSAENQQPVTVGLYKFHVIYEVVELNLSFTSAELKLRLF